MTCVNYFRKLEDGIDKLHTESDSIRVNEILSLKAENETLKLRLNDIATDWQVRVAENKALRKELKTVAKALNTLRISVEGVLWPNNGFATGTLYGGKED